MPRGTQRLIAELSGITPETITRWKGGKGNPRLDELESLADALKVSVVYLISDEREEAPTYPTTRAEDRRVDKILEQAEQLRAEVDELMKRRKP